jgi:hypothetical protein
MENDGTPQAHHNLGGSAASQAQVDQWYLERGRDYARVERHMGWARHTQVWVYQLIVKFPRTPLGQHTCIVKGIAEGEFVIAFQSNDGLGQALAALGRRLEAGVVKWKPDDYPPHKADEILRDWTTLYSYYRD